MINLDELEPLVACPNQPDQVRALKDIEREKELIKEGGLLRFLKKQIDTI